DLTLPPQRPADWRYTADGPLLDFIVLNSGDLATRTHSRVGVLTPTGECKWSASVLLSQRILEAGQVLIVESSQRIVAFNKETGEEAWQTDRFREVLAAVDDHLLVDGYLLDSSSGLVLESAVGVGKNTELIDGQPWVPTGINNWWCPRQRAPCQEMATTSPVDLHGTKLTLTDNILTAHQGKRQLWSQTIADNGLLPLDKRAVLVQLGTDVGPWIVLSHRGRIKEVLFHGSRPKVHNQSVYALIHGDIHSWRVR
ncbi:MAG: hypothetical protein HN348_15195, partial [Proteobacteria bacterium]|nr:hypothetical protein [Pseudomonadota bacterium]